MKQLKDYLHLYLGCECMVQENGGSEFKSILEGIQNGKYLLKEYGYLLLWNSTEVKPILRPLSDMTEEEAIELAQIHKYDIPEDDGVREELINVYSDDGELTLGRPYLPISMYKQGLLWLLKQGFDLFGLIESGLAFDKTKTPQQ